MTAQCVGTASLTALQPQRDGATNYKGTTSKYAVEENLKINGEECDVALETLPTDMEAVVREVTKETTAAEIWTKLTSLYMAKSLANKLYLKKKLYKYYTSPGMKLGDRIDEFNKLILDLANIDIEIEDEDQALMLLTSLPSSYENFVETLLYGRESVTPPNGA
ncbi:hypothetical protein Tco_0745422 [Tanacetum coccineum]